MLTFFEGLSFLNPGSHKGNFHRISKIQGFWIKKIVFSKIWYLGGSGLFVHTFSEIWKMVFLYIYQLEYGSVAITELQTYIISI